MYTNIFAEFLNSNKVSMNSEFQTSLKYKCHTRHGLCHPWQIQKPCQLKLNVNYGRFSQALRMAPSLHQAETYFLRTSQVTERQ